MIRRPFAHLLSALRLCLVLAVVAVVASCGGGGTPGGKDLHVSFDYPASYLRLWEPASVAPSLGGLHGNAPRYSLVSGSLASGLALGGDCVVRGTPMQVGAFGGTVRLTVNGYDGYVDAWNDGTVPAPSLFAAQAHLTVDGVSWSVLWGVPESAQMFNLANFNQQEATAWFPPIPRRTRSGRDILCGINTTVTAPHHQLDRAPSGDIPGATRAPPRLAPAVRGYTAHICLLMH